MRSRLRDTSGSVTSTILVALGMMAFIILSIVVGRLYWHHSLLEFPAYKATQTYISQHPQIAETIGEIKDWDATPTGNFDYNKKQGNGSLSMTVVGTKGVADITVNLESEFDQLWIIQKAMLRTSAMSEPLILDTPAAWLKAANRLLDQQEFEPAQRICQIIAEATPEDYRGEYCLAEIARGKGDQEGYLRIRQALAEKEPNFHLYQSQLGYAYYTVNRLDKSVEYYQKAWQLSGQAQTASEIAEIYMEKGDVHIALEWLEKAKEAGLRSASLAYGFGRYYLVSKDYKTASEYFNLALSLDPEFADAYFGLAYLRQQLDEQEKAIYYFEQGLDRKLHAPVRHRIALIDLLIKNHDYDAAIYHTRKAIGYNDNNPFLYVILSKLYEKEGRKDSADLAFDQAKRIDANLATKFANEVNI